MPEHFSVIVLKTGTENRKNYKSSNYLYIYTSVLKKKHRMRSKTVYKIIESKNKYA